MFSCKICQIFKNTYFEEHLRTTASKHKSNFLEVFCRSYCSALINAVMKCSSFIATQKLESVTFKFTKNCTPSQAFFIELHFKSRTAILKNALRWLLLRTNLFWCMAASQRQLQTYIHFRNSYTYFTFVTLTSC